MAGEKNHKNNNKNHEKFCPSLGGKLVTIAKRSSSKHLVGTKVLWGDP